MAVTLACMIFAQQQQPQDKKQSLPESPTPHTIPALDSVTPGKALDAAPPTAPAPAPAATGVNTIPADAPQDQAAPLTPTVHDDDGPPPDMPASAITTINVRVNFIEVPFIVKDKKGKLVPGITWRDVRVFENGRRQQLRFFSVDPYPISVALVIDQSLPFDTMTKVNNALNAITGAFTPYDEMAVFTYNNGPKLQTDFTGAQSPRLAGVIERAKTGGREMNYYAGGSPLGQTTNINGHQFDPNTSPVRNQLGTAINIPKEIHTLNDAVFEAAKSLTNRAPGRRRIIYVISDGKEAGSHVKQSEVIRFCQTNKIAVYATVVGDSAAYGLGFLDRFHIPLMMADNILPHYTAATGGQIDSEYRQKGIETSFAKIAEEVRTQYTAGYISREPVIDGKFRKLEVQVLKPGLSVIAKDGYYPNASDTKR